MSDNITGMRVAILATDGFELSELQDPKKALEAAGAITSVVSMSSGKIRGWKGKDWADEVSVDLTLEQAKAEDFDALLLPGGLMNPDKLRMTPAAVDFVKAFVKFNKPIAAICHAPWILINAEAVKGKTVTSWPSLKIDLMNAGAHWVDQEVALDDHLVTSRKPDDIPAFSKAMIELFFDSRALMNK